MGTLAMPVIGADRTPFLVTLSHEIYYDHLIKLAIVQGAEAEPNQLGSYIEQLFHCMLSVSLSARKPLCD